MAEVVAGLIPHPKNALWIVSAPEFQRQHYSQRVWARHILSGYRNPERALDNWMGRDNLYSSWVTGGSDSLV
jgi:hypothetical protein